MPGAYAHLTIVGSLMESNSLNKASGFTNPARAALLDYSCFCDLGAVSPDYPYLDILSSKASTWADLMHYKNTGKMIKAGVKAIRKLDENARPKLFAWLLGYTSHVVTDTTIHPVVELKVGPYAQNKKEHRVCEMHQDAHIFRRLNIGAVGLSEYLDSGLRACSLQCKDKKLPAKLTTLWGNMLKKCHPEQYKTNPPDINHWHSAFLNNVDLAEDGGRLPPFARHVGVNMGLTYPNPEEVENQYILDLKTPEGVMSYDTIFDRAKQNVLDMWSAIAAAIYRDDDNYLSLIGEWNLDTGHDEQNKLVYWEERV